MYGVCNMPVQYRSSICIIIFCFLFLALRLPQTLCLTECTSVSVLLCFALLHARTHKNRTGGLFLPSDVACFESCEYYHVCRLMPPVVDFFFSSSSFSVNVVGTLHSKYFFLNKINLIIIKILFSWINLLS